MANELNTIVESSLGGLAAGRTIATVRVVDDTGGSANASPTQIREMTGIDYSKWPDGQAIPGEFMPTYGGISRPVLGHYVHLVIPEGQSGDIPLGFSAFGLVQVLGFIASAANNGIFAHPAVKYVHNKIIDSPLDYQVYLTIPFPAQYGWRVQIFVKYVNY